MDDEEVVFDFEMIESLGEKRKDYLCMPIQNNFEIPGMSQNLFLSYLWSDLDKMYDFYKGQKKSKLFLLKRKTNHIFYVKKLVHGRDNIKYFYDNGLLHAIHGDIFDNSSMYEFHFKTESDMLLFKLKYPELSYQ
jgi:hypothetical protein